MPSSQEKVRLFLTASGVSNAVIRNDLIETTTTFVSGDFFNVFTLSKPTRYRFVSGLSEIEVDRRGLDVLRDALRVIDYTPASFDDLIEPNRYGALSTRGPTDSDEESED